MSEITTDRKEAARRLKLQIRGRRRALQQRHARCSHRAPVYQLVLTPEQLVLLKEYDWMCFRMNTDDKVRAGNWYEDMRVVTHRTGMHIQEF